MICSNDLHASRQCARRHLHTCSGEIIETLSDFYISSTTSATECDRGAGCTERYRVHQKHASNLADTAKDWQVHHLWNWPGHWRSQTSPQRRWLLRCRSFSCTETVCRLMPTSLHVLTKTTVPNIAAVRKDLGDIGQRTTAMWLHLTPCAMLSYQPSASFWMHFSPKNWRVPGRYGWIQKRNELSYLK